MAISALKNPSIVLVFALVLSPLAAFAQSDDADALIIMVNLERMRAQLQLVDQSLATGDTEAAFAHAFIPHTTTFPSIKKQLKELDDQSATELEARLTDLPIDIRTGDLPVDSLRQAITGINALLDTLLAKLGPLASDKDMVSQTVVFLLRDAVQSYQMSNRGSSQVEHENAIGLVNVAESKYQSIADSFDGRRSAEIDSFFADLKGLLEQKAANESLVRLATALERDFAEELSLSAGSGSASEHTTYFSNIRRLLANVVTEVNNGNYEQADQHAITAYLDNYEYLEAPIEKHDPDLMLGL
ncbi:MAG: hypothetical protein AB1351_13390, partial [Thermoproteota archaeon]